MVDDLVLASLFNVCLQMGLYIVPTWSQLIDSMPMYLYSIIDSRFFFPDVLLVFNVNFLAVLGGDLG